jgi:hypothetical protein
MGYLYSLFLLVLDELYDLGVWAIEYFRDKVSYE